MVKSVRLIATVNTEGIKSFPSFKKGKGFSTQKLFQRLNFSKAFLYSEREEIEKKAL